jgi:hypothetical protein
MSALVDRIDSTNGAVRARIKALPADDSLTKKLRDLSGRMEEVKKKIVATKEGGAITGEERIREHANHLYAALMSWEGRPASYQVERIDVLGRELDDAKREFDLLMSKDVSRLSQELAARNLGPIASVTVNDDESMAVVATALRCFHDVTRCEEGVAEQVAELE